MRYRFSPPAKNKFFYYVLNIVVIIIAAFVIYNTGGKIAIVGLALGVFFLLNGLWSINKSNYSLIHRDNKSYAIEYSWIFFLFLGVVLIVLGILDYFLK